MASDRSKSQSGERDDHSGDHRLTDAYHRDIEMDRPDGQAFVLIFGGTAHQFNFRRGDARALIASRLREFADRLESGGDNA